MLDLVKTGSLFLFLLLHSGVKCSTLPTSSKFTVSPPRCLKTDTNLFEQTCSFACIKGYEPVDQSNMVVTCLADRQWSSGPPQCQGK